MNTKVVVPWHNQDQLTRFLSAWDLARDDRRVIFQQDKDHEGCAVTKNKGVRAAIDSGATIVIVLDDDCFPEGDQTLDAFMRKHKEALEPQPVTMFQGVTSPPSRGTPYLNRAVTMPVAASMGFWTEIGDYDALGQLVHGATHPMIFQRETIFGRYFPLCGMNLAFRATEWPWCQFIDVSRFDDIWQGFLWQKNAYRNGQCFNLAGPLVRHSRQSNVWKNLRDETLHLEANESLWSDIFHSTAASYDALRALLPV